MKGCLARSKTMRYIVENTEDRDDSMRFISFLNSILIEFLLEIALPLACGSFAGWRKVLEYRL